MGKFCLLDLKRDIHQMAKKNKVAKKVIGYYKMQSNAFRIWKGKFLKRSDLKLGTDFRSQFWSNVRMKNYVFLVWNRRWVSKTALYTPPEIPRRIPSCSLLHSYYLACRATRLLPTTQIMAERETASQGTCVKHSCTCKIITHQQVLSMFLIQVL